MTQVFVYPEELELVEPRALADQVASLGCDELSIALAYHRARRVLPRHRRVSLSPGGAVSFTPDAARYARLEPRPTASAVLRRSVEALREACRDAGVGFRAWLVALHSEALATRHPELAARTVDGAPTGFSLCPSAPDVVEYVAALVRDVCSRLEPDGVDLEAALYPAWDPAYTLTLSLAPLDEPARLYGAQCFCRACRGRPGLAALEQRTRSAAGPPFADRAAQDATLAAELGAARASAVRMLVAAAVEAAHGHGARLCVTVSGSAASASLRGLTPTTVEAADSVLFGLATLSGDELAARLAELRPLAGDRPVSASLNWTPERTPAALAEDARRAAAGGAGGLALYNLSLVPEAGLDAFRAAAAAFAEAGRDSGS